MIRRLYVALSIISDRTASPHPMPDVPNLQTQPTSVDVGNADVIFIRHLERELPPQYRRVSRVDRGSESILASSN